MHVVLHSFLTKTTSTYITERIAFGNGTTHTETKGFIHRAEYSDRLVGIIPGVKAFRHCALGI